MKQLKQMHLNGSSSSKLWRQDQGENREETGVFSCVLHGEKLFILRKEGESWQIWVATENVFIIFTQIWWDIYETNTIFLDHFSRWLISV